MAKTLRTSGDYIVKTGSGASGSNEVTFDSKDVRILGDLTVDGATVTVNTTNTTIEDPIFELSRNNSGPADIDAGIMINRGASNNAAIYWNEGDDKFKAVTTTSAADATSITDTALASFEVGPLGATTGTFSSGISATTGAFSGAITSVGATVSGDITAGSVTTNEIASNGSNADITIDPVGTGNINLTAGADVIIPANIGLVLDGSGNEKIESDGTDISISVGSGGDINIPADIGLTFGDDGEKIEGDGTNLTIASSGILTLTATGNTAITNNATIGGTLSVTGISTLTGALTVNDSVTATSVTANDFTSNGSNADITIAPQGTGDINLTGGADVNLPANIGLTFGNDGEKIEGDGTDLTLSSSNNFTIDAANDVTIDAGNADIKFQDDGTEFGRISRVTSDLVIKSMGNNNDMLFKGLDDTATITALTLDMSEAGAATFNASVTAGTSFIIGSADINETDLEKIDGITNGAGAANKALVLDANADVASGLRNLTTSGKVVSPTVELTNAHIESGTVTHSGSSGQQVLDSFVAATFRGGVYTVSISDSAEGKFETVQIYVTHDGSTSYIQSTGVSSTGSTMATFSTDISDSNVRILIVPISNNSTTYKFSRTLIEV